MHIHESYQISKTLTVLSTVEVYSMTLSLECWRVIYSLFVRHAVMLN